MSENVLDLGHSELVSVVLCLAEKDRQGRSPFFSGLGFTPEHLELRLADSRGRNFVADVHLLCRDRNYSLLVECKTHAPIIDPLQIEKYLATGGEEIVRTGASVPNPREHSSATMFFVLPTVTQELAVIIASLASPNQHHWGIVEFDGESIACPHNEFDDIALSNAFEERASVDVESIYLDRVPFESDAPDTVLANIIFQSLITYFTQGKAEFSLEELCQDTDPVWDMREDVQQKIAKRIKGHMRTVRKHVLKGWLDQVETGSGREEKWRFQRAGTTNLNTLRALQSRQSRYVQALADRNKNAPGDPFSFQDYFDLRDEQLGLPVVIDVGRYLPFEPEPDGED